MKTALTYLLLTTVTFSLSASGTSKSLSDGGATTRWKIFKSLKERRDAFYRGDIAKFSAFETDDFTRITEGGRLVTKKEQLAYLKTQSAAWVASSEAPLYADRDLKLDVYGDVAILTGRLTETEKSKSGQRQIEESRFTEIWVYRRGRWQTLHNHYTTIVQ